MPKFIGDYPNIGQCLFKNAQEDFASGINDDGTSLEGASIKHRLMRFDQQTNSRGPVPHSIIYTNDTVIECLKAHAPNIQLPADQLNFYGVVLICDTETGATSINDLTYRVHLCADENTAMKLDKEAIEAAQEYANEYPRETEEDDFDSPDMDLIKGSRGRRQSSYDDSEW